MRNNPHIYEINLMAWLNELSARQGCKVSLSQVPASQWENIKRMGMDAVWLMGMWERSPVSQIEARKAEILRRECEKILPDFQIADLGGSPYAVRSYSPDPQFGDTNDLRALKKTLNDIGLRLILDFVPNHTACDHHWVREHPEYYINASPGSAGTCPDGFFRATSTQRRICIAHGKDPYFPPWTDTAQLNYGKRDTHEAMKEALQSISELCDGLRCDMAMLVLNDVFGKTWAQYLTAMEEPQEFWPYAINSIRDIRANFTFIAESYWGLEKQLLEAGFNYSYDKDFYDALINSDVESLKNQLSRALADQERLLRFLENHDEARAMDVFGRDRIKAAMVIHATVPGARLWYHGQFEGRRMRVPVQLRRAPEEPPDKNILEFSAKLLEQTGQPIFHEGLWQMCAVDGWLDNQSCKSLLAWGLQHGRERALIAVNFSDIPSQGRIRFPRSWFGATGNLKMTDPIKEEKYSARIEDAETQGLYVGLKPWDFHFFHIHFD